MQFPSWVNCQHCTQPTIFYYKAALRNILPFSRQFHTSQHSITQAESKIFSSLLNLLPSPHNGWEKRISAYLKL